jgi:hypothetical protein
MGIAGKRPAWSIRQALIAGNISSTANAGDYLSFAESRGKQWKRLKVSLQSLQRFFSEGTKLSDWQAEGHQG